MNVPILIAFGSNIEPEHNLMRGLIQLHRQIGCHGISSVYRTKAIPDPKQPSHTPTNDPDFLNGALLIRTEWEPMTIQRHLKQIELDLGRNPDALRWAPRPLDLDLVLMGDCQLQTPTLTLPDPEILTRPFVAIPLAQLAPEWLHPTEKISLSAIAARFLQLPHDLIPDPATTERLQTILQ